ncbi:uncharacterized protein BCR38DRAFT_388524 [Pseudomassariella vexata]|uniref:SMP-LTD domain-containing protein n=1 Tax=Pseudomassariella vexata TaxID=1141098 RepID=A0A1Y2EA28_9PEZI|nr:uncharacterized protein BCR38DRAFT_388524 [Pseudomassariella vexata]ORY67715.1 hypothetical protein BCR38DRAFT_388524 [Pseudomassariella vexata]
MGSWTGFLLTYLLGGVTFIPLLLVAVLIHAYFTFPIRHKVDNDNKANGPDDGSDSIVQPGDDTTDLKVALKAQKVQEEEGKPKHTDVIDVAAGYFAVCREYTPMGINAKPIERSTPVGMTTVAAPSQSVYQVMYRSIFDRKQSPSPLDNANGGSGRPKRAGNVFYVVLRHGHLMLFDDDEQLEVRHVISLAHHDVSIYSGGDTTPEGELYIKRNALCLSRNKDGFEIAPDTQISKPFYLFSENCSAKEDFYFALLRNKEQVFGPDNKAPQPQRFEVKNIISLVHKLHSSEEHLQTRWLNALIGRIFLGLYKTCDMENAIREKITKKISRVKRPSFLTRIAIQKIDTGDSTPFITNPRLKELNIEGEYVMEADVRYTGNFRLEVAATARIDLGSRFKAREVNLVLAVVLKKLEGHILFKIKPPPSNRIWFSFQTMPKMETMIEPIVSSRQITYTVILRQIENRIKEVVAETLVLPFWDDMPFFKTEHKQWRGGIFVGDDAVEHSEDYEEIAAALGHVDEVSHIEETGAPTSPELPPVAKSHSLPVVEKDSTQSTGFWGRKVAKKPTTVGGNQSASASTTALDAKSPRSSTPETSLMPRAIRKGSFSASNPTVGTDPTHSETFKPSSSPPDHDAVSAIANLAAKSNKESSTSIPSPRMSFVKASERSSTSSLEALTAGNENENEKTPVSPARRGTTSSVESSSSEANSSGSPAPSTKGSMKSATGSIGRGLFSRRETGQSVASNGTNGAPENKRNTLAAVSNAAATAKRWGLNALQRNSDQGPDGHKPDHPTVDLSQPMGRGQPIPASVLPPPEPDRRPKATPQPVPKRRPMPPPQSSSARESSTCVNSVKKDRRVPPPPLPRRRRLTERYPEEGNDEMFVVEAPADSEPTTPMHEEHDHEHSHPYMPPWVEDSEDFDGSDEHSTPSEVPILPKPGPPALPKRVFEGARRHTDDDDDYSNWLDNPEFEANEDGRPEQVEEPRKE